MHFAYPPRKSSNPPPFRPRSTKLAIPPLLRRSRLKTLALIGLGVIGFIFLLSSLFGGGGSSGSSEARIPSGQPPVVIVTVLDQGLFSESYYQNIKDNRIQYAKKHGRFSWLQAPVGMRC